MTSGTPQLTFYNTLTRKKEPFVPIDADNVRLYACGPTVYDFAHIGNGRMAIVFDLLFRLLRQTYGAEHVTYVRNITDVDDKINARAARDFPGLKLNEAIRKVTESTAAQYQADVTALGCLEPTIQPRATDNIEGMQALIAALIQRRHAYEANGEVLFEVGSMPDYGKLSGRNPEDNLAGARVAVDAHKKNPADFVLWKQSSAEEPGWDSPWGRGRPGWHIECSAMSERYLGQLFDIHGGGLDLIFPHHENEIAQSRCAHGTHAMANVWMHNGFLQVEGEKMSKSLGNFLTIYDALKIHLGDTIRWLMLKTHYRQSLDFSSLGMAQASSELSKLCTAALALPQEIKDLPWLLEPEFEARLLDDLDTAGAIARLHVLASSEDRRSRASLQQALKFLGIQNIDRPAAFRRSVAFWGNVPEEVAVLAIDWKIAALNGLDTISERLQERAQALGWTMRLQNGSVEIQQFGDRVTLNEKVQATIATRLAALNAKDFATADRIRAELAEQGIALMDSKDPETGERKTKWEMKR